MTDYDHIRFLLTKARTRLMTTFEGLNVAQWATTVYEAPPFAVSDVLRHLVDAESAFVVQIDRIRHGGDGVPADFDLHRWNQRVIVKTKDKTPAELLANLNASRDRLWELLDSFSDADWQIEGRHPNAEIGVVSIEKFVRIIGLHERSHNVDIRRALNL